MAGIKLKRSHSTLPPRCPASSPLLVTSYLFETFRDVSRKGAFLRLGQDVQFARISITGVRSEEDNEEILC